MVGWNGGQRAEREPQGKEGKKELEGWVWVWRRELSGWDGMVEVEVDASCPQSPKAQVECEMWNAAHAEPLE